MLRLTAVLVAAMSLHTRADIVLDQSSPGDSSGNNFSFGFESPAVIQQGVTAGVTGQLMSFEFFATARMNATADVFVNLGSAWQSDEHDFVVNIQWPDVDGWFSVDVSSGSIFLVEQQAFVIGFQNPVPQAGFGGTHNCDEDPYSGGALWTNAENPAGEPWSDGCYDLGFRTFVLVPTIPAIGGYGLLVIAASMIAAGVWIMKRRTLAG